MQIESDPDPTALQEPAGEDFADGEGEPQGTGLDAAEVADAANKILGEDYQEDDEIIQEIVETGNEMLDIPIDVSLEPIAVELEPPVEEKYEPKEETLQFDELFGKVEELSGVESDEV